MTIDRRDLGAGLSFILIALFFGLTALFQLRLGSLRQLGPGLFPLGISGILLLIGAVLLVRSFGRENVRLGAFNWRSTIAILLAPVVFGIGIRPLGLVPTLLLTLFIAFLATRDANWKLAIAVILGLTAFCAVVFIQALGVPVPLLGPVFGG